MPELEASRTLVKSGPELWAECSDGAALSRHLGAFGEIRITKLEPETSVAWEGDDVSGTVTLEPSGWGTRVVLTATPEPAVEAAANTAADPPPRADTPPPEPATPPEPEPEPAATAPVPAGDTPSPDPEAPPSGFFARLMARLRGQPPTAPAATEAEPTGVTPEPAAMPELAGEPQPAPVPVSEPRTRSAPELEALIGALDSLGTAHRRPFSRG